VLVVLNLLGFSGTVIVNALANALPINNMTTGELSDLYPNLFVPAGMTFAIWGLIYLLLGFFCIYQFAVAFRGDEGSFVSKIGVYFIIVSIANIAWILAWHFQQIALSLALMIVLLGTLIKIYLDLDIGLNNNASKPEKYLVHMPFSVYLGWISIATIANVVAFLVSINWNGFGISDAIWTIAVIIVGIILAVKYMLCREDIYYAMVINWALFGIYIKRAAADIRIQSVINVSVLGMVLIGALVVIQVIRKRVY